MASQSAGTASLQRSQTPNECTGFDTKQSDGENIVMLELLEMWSNTSLPSFSGHFCSGVGALSMGQIHV